MLLTLSDIELAQDLLKKRAEEDAKLDAKVEEESHPLDKNYSMLNCTLAKVAPGSSDFKLIDNYFNATNKSGWWQSAKKIINVWRMDRRDEQARFAVHKQVANRKLLWHGTKMAVVAAILKSGLRIVPG